MNDPKNEEEVISFDDEFGGTPITADPKAKPRKIGDVIQEIDPDGYGCKFEELVGKKIVVTGLKPFRGQYGAALYVKAVDQNGELFHTVVGAGVPARKLWQVKDALPVTCTVIQKDSTQYGKYYDLE
jgi:hypothetical protein